MSLLLLFNFPGAQVLVIPAQIIAVDTTYGSETVTRSLLDSRLLPAGAANVPTAMFVACGITLQGNGQLILVRPDGSSIAVPVTRIGDVDLSLPPGVFEANTYGLALVGVGVLNQIGTWQCSAQFGLFLSSASKFTVN